MTTTPPSAGPAEVRPIADRLGFLEWNCGKSIAENHQDDPDVLRDAITQIATLSAQCAAQARELAELRERLIEAEGLLHELAACTTRSATHIMGTLWGDAAKKFLASSRVIP